MKPDSKSTVLISTVSVACAVIAAYNYHKRKLKDVTEKLSLLRDAERKGRIKAEINLRSTIKRQEDKRLAAALAFYDGDKSKTNNENKLASDDKPMLLRCIGSVVSPFTKRMGTPRQGALAPHARAYIEMNASVAPMETLLGIETYSHAWIIFCFHANTDLQSKTLKTKVKPPRAGGIKVGSMATRSPHRPNNIGLSLVKITGIDHKKKRLHIAALDLVNGTPVYDIKPVVPWDIPGHFDDEPLSVPKWVSQDDALSNVSFTTDAESELEFLIKRKMLSPLYAFDELDIAKLAMKEILAQDPRAAKKRGKIDNSSDPYSLSFGKIQIQFVVVDHGKVEVVKVSEMKLNNATFVDGVPLSKEGTMS
jgi:tRNA-Thr(GGU) m(6)t(6)A37 methyltransferase TsaA